MAKEFSFADLNKEMSKISEYGEYFRQINDFRNRSLYTNW